MKNSRGFHQILAVLFLLVFFFPTRAGADDYADTCSEAAVIGSNSITAGEIETPGDWDYFKLTFESGGVLTVFSTGNMDTYGYLLDSECNILLEDDDNGQNANFSIQTSLNAGTYHVAVRHYSADRVGGYLLNTAFAPDDHGNDCESATSISCNSAASGNIYPAGDLDCFEIQMTGSGILTVYTEGSTNTYGYLLAGDCSEIAHHDNISGSNKNFRIEETVTPGTYYVLVRHYNTSRTGTYTLQVTCSAFYSITAAAGQGGTVTPTGTLTVSEGDSQTFAIEPNFGNAIEDVLVDGVSVGAVASYTFSNIAADHTLYASFSVPPESCVDIADAPLDARRHGAPANIMFVVDDSGSMDWEFMTSEVDGLFDGFSYIFDNPGDNIYKTGVYSRILEGEDRMRWKSQWSGYNRMYYNPSTDYEPWPTFSDADPANPRSHPTNADLTFNLGGTYSSIDQAIIIDDRGEGFSCSGYWYSASASDAYNGYYYWTPYDGEYTAAWTPGDRLPAGTFEVYTRWFSNAYRSESVAYTVHHAGGDDTVFVNQRLNGGAWVLLGTYDFAAATGGVSLHHTRRGDDDRACADAVKFVPAGAPTLNITQAHYYAWSFEEQKPYLVVLDGAIRYYRIDDRDRDEKAAFGEVIQNIAPPSDVVTGRSYAAERQNFANWYSYYRRRELAATAAMANVIVNMQGVQIGIRSINGYLVQPVLKIKVAGIDETARLLESLYTYGVVLKQAATPLRAGLRDTCRYFNKTDDNYSWGDGGVGPSPIATAEEGGECQQNFAVVFTDGHYNGGAPGFGNEDGDNGVPYADGIADTLADVAMYYYENDLAPDLQDLVPVNPYDDATHQHVVTYGISFGVFGSLNPADYDLVDGPYPEWPNPSITFQYKIDDLWHASVNARGRYLITANPEELLNAFTAIMQDIEARIGSASSVSINGDELYGRVGEGVYVFQSTYYSDGWSGDVKAYSVNPLSGDVTTNAYVWSAADRLEETDWDTERRIATYDGSSTGTPFRFDQLTAEQKARLDPDWESDDSDAVQLLNFLRGDTGYELENGGTFRSRFRILGDIVHSSPLFEGGMLYAGGNDGMLHAFDPDTGGEMFAFIPNLVFENLPQLADAAYIHRYYVDLTPTASPGVTLSGVAGRTLLAGGLGKGGKGFYALDVTDPFLIATETELAARVLWEYPNDATPAAERDLLGFTYSRPVIVDSKAGWVVIAGNGYNSLESRAVLLILDPSSGSLIKSIDTGVGSCNGLSTPVAVDVDYDRKVDYVYAGDLRGNLWKFDLTAESPAFWDVAYKEGSSPRPLFQAKGPGGSLQPITTKPDVMFHCSRHGYMVIFGTGRYLGDSDFYHSGAQTVYGIWDYGDDADDSEYLGSFERSAENRLSNQPTTVSLLQQTQIDWRQVENNYLRTLSNNTPVWTTGEDGDENGFPDPSAETANHAGWYFDLPFSKERVVVDVLLRDGKAIVISFEPEASPCGTGGDSIVHEMDACTGGRLATPQIDIDDDGDIDDQDRINIGDEDNPVWVAPTGFRRPGRLQPPAILRLDNHREVKYFSSSTGSIVTLRERAVRLGMGYWIEVAR